MLLTRLLRLAGLLSRLPLFLLLLAAAAAAETDRHWPHWRGPDGNGVAPHGDPPVRWSETSNVRWKVEVPGHGHASPVVWDDRIYLLTAIPVEEPAAAASASEAAAAPAEPPRIVIPDRELRFAVLALDRRRLPAFRSR